MFRFRDGVLTWQRDPPRVEAHQSGDPSWAAKYRWRNDDGGEGSGGATFIDAADTPITVGPSGDVALDTNVRIRVLVDEQNTGGGGSYTHDIGFSINGGAFDDVTTATLGVRLVGSAHFTTGDPTTDHGLTASSGAFVAGEISSSASDPGARTIDQDDYTIHEWCLQFRSADLSDGDEITFQVQTAGGDDADNVPLTGTPATVSAVSGDTATQDAPVSAAWAGIDAVATPGAATATGSLATAAWAALDAGVAVDATATQDAAASAAWGALDAVASPGTATATADLASASWSALDADAVPGAATATQGAASTSAWGVLAAAAVAGAVVATGTLATASWTALDAVASVGPATATQDAPATSTWAALDAGAQPGAVTATQDASALAAWAARDAAGTIANTPQTATGQLASAAWGALDGSGSLEGAAQIASGALATAAWLARDATVQASATAIQGTSASVGWAALDATPETAVTVTQDAPATASWAAIDATAVPGAVQGSQDGIVAATWAALNGTASTAEPIVHLPPGGLAIVTIGPRRVRLPDHSATVRLTGGPAHVRLSDRATRAILAMSPALARVEGPVPFTIKVGETSRPLRVRLVDGDGTTPDLTGATVEFAMSPADSTATTVSGAAAEVLEASPPADPDDPNVQYEFDAPDVATPGNYAGEFKVTTSTGAIGFYPSEGHIPITIRKAIT